MLHFVCVFAFYILLFYNRNFYTNKNSDYITIIKYNNKKLNQYQASNCTAIKYLTNDKTELFNKQDNVNNGKVWNTEFIMQKTQ